MSGRDKIAEYLRERVGQVVEGDELYRASGGIRSHARRVRELRTEYGYPIQTHLDAEDLRPGQYRLTALPPDKPPPHFTRQVSQRLRALVIQRNSSTCQMCGRGVGDTFEDGGRVLLHVDHIINKDEGGSDDLNNLRTLCNRCNQGSKNIVTAPESLLWLKGKVRTASRDNQLAIYEWLHNKFKEHPL